MTTKSRPGWIHRAGFFVLAMSGPAWGNGIQYNYLEASWLKQKPEQTGSAQSDGWRLTSSAPLDGSSFLRARYGRVEDDNKAKSSLLSIGLGALSVLTPNTDGYGVLSYEEIDNKSSANDKGFALELGLRWAASERLQVDFGGNYLKLDRAGEDIQWFGEGLIHLAPGFALSGRYTWAEADTRYSVGLRLFQR